MKTMHCHLTRKFSRSIVVYEWYINRWYLFISTAKFTARHNISMHKFAKYLPRTIKERNYGLIKHILYTLNFPGYKSDIYPDVTAVFDASAIRYIMTLIPAGLHQR